MLQAVAEEVFHGNTPIDGVHENIELVHCPERGLRPLTQSKRKSYCGVALLSSCKPCAAAEEEQCMRMLSVYREKILYGFLLTV